MTMEYMASVDSRYNLTKYTLNSGVEIILNVEEMEELFKGSKLRKEIESLRAENQKVTYKRDYDKGLIRTFTSTLNEMKGV
mgnify:CR=1 FL=1